MPVLDGIGLLKKVKAGGIGNGLVGHLVFFFDPTPTSANLHHTR